MTIREKLDDPKTLGFLVLRAFFAQFWLLQWFGKIRDSESGIVAVRNLGIWSDHLTAYFLKTTPLLALDWLRGKK